MEVVIEESLCLRLLGGGRARNGNVKAGLLRGVRGHED